MACKSESQQCWNSSTSYYMFTICFHFFFTWNMLLVVLFPKTKEKFTLKNLYGHSNTGCIVCSYDMLMIELHGSSIQVNHAIVSYWPVVVVSAISCPCVARDMWKGWKHEESQSSCVGLIHKPWISMCLKTKTDESMERSVFPPRLWMPKPSIKGREYRYCGT